MIPGKNFDAVSGKAPPHVTEPNSADGGYAAGASTVDATWLERRVALDLLAGEVCHELAPTLLYLGCLANEERSSALSPENGELVHKQIERLQRLSRLMRRLVLPPPAREPVPILDILKQAEAGVAALLREKRVALTWAGAQSLTLRTDGPLFSLLVRELVASAARDAKPASVVDVQVTPPCGQAEGTIEVWRASAENVQQIASQVFDLGQVMQGSVANLGLPLCHRVARTLGWELLARNGAGRAGCQLLIPAAAFSAELAR